jgi:acetyltransferase EpsM
MDDAGLLVLGCGIFAEEVADLALDAGQRVAGFVENLDRDRAGGELLGLPVHWVDDIAALAADHVAVCGIGTTRRRGYVEQVQALGLGFGTVRHPGARVSSRSTVGDGCVVSAGVVVATATAVGRHAILNRGVLVGHHSRIGDYVTVSPGANVAGCVTIGDGAYVGIGAVILDRLTIGEGAVVGAGAVVTRDVPAGTQVLGVPARVVKTGVQGR